LGVEIQSDSIGSSNNGLPNKTSSVPYDLIQAERERFYSDMMAGFRYIRLAMGRYLRGVDSERKHIIERFPGQVDLLQEMVVRSGAEGYAVEYWSPAPYWKDNGGFIGGTLKDSSPEFLDQFGSALAQDLKYLESHGCPVIMWGLQNEPPVGEQQATYSTCYYTPELYYSVFKVIAPKIKEYKSSIFVHVDSWAGQEREHLIAQDSTARSYVDGWTWHQIGSDSTMQIQQKATLLNGTFGRPVFNNEYEYLSGQATPARCINTAQSIMNWFVFENSPTWFWLHALKPTYNAEASGYGLGYWRPLDDNDFSHFANLSYGHWQFNNYNWHSIKGFIKLIPWNSVRIEVTEEQIELDNRILVVKTPVQNKLIIVLTNRQNSTFTFNIQTGVQGSSFNGIRYTPQTADLEVGSQKGRGTLAITLPPLSIEFWLEQ